jgi:hypothetical protein
MAIGGMSRGQALKAAFLGVLLGALPHVLGLFLGFAAFVVTPIAFAITGVGGGVLIACLMQRARWSAVALSSLLAGATFTSLLYVTFGVLSVVNIVHYHSVPTTLSGPDAARAAVAIIAYSALGFFVVSAIAAILVTGGLLLGGLGQAGRRST